MSDNDKRESGDKTRQHVATRQSALCGGDVGGGEHRGRAARALQAGDGTAAPGAETNEKFMVKNGRSHWRCGARRAPRDADSVRDWRYTNTTGRQRRVVNQAVFIRTVKLAYRR